MRLVKWWKQLEQEQKRFAFFFGVLFGAWHLFVAAIWVFGNDSGGVLAALIMDLAALAVVGLYWVGTKLFPDTK